MLAIVDKQAKAAIGELCDLALKIGGVKNLKGVSQILDCMQPLPVEKPPAEGKNQPQRSMHHGKEGD
jgi:hypothetical protein